MRRIKILRRAKAEHGAWEEQVRVEEALRGCCGGLGSICLTGAFDAGVRVRQAKIV